MADSHAVLSRLRALVRADLDSSDDLLSRLEEALAQMGPESSDSDRMAIGGYLHHLYTACEAALERVVREVDGRSPSGPHSHRELLECARVAVPSVRPRLVSQSTFDALARLLSFRHAYRHGYAMRLEWSRLGPLVHEARDLCRAVRSDLDAFFESAIGGTGT